MAKPFLKWAGGKAKLAPQIVAAAPPRFGRYHEPFAGAAAVFFALRAAQPEILATLSDANADLIECFAALRDDIGGLSDALQQLAGQYLAGDELGRQALYYEVRGRAPSTRAERAARLLFLNKTCYNGLYRVNSSGRFNVPHGRYLKPGIFDAQALAAASAALVGVELCACDFEAACAKAETGDFVYLDPPYQPLSRTARFTGYTRVDFGPAEQERLRDVFDRLSGRGVKAMLSNSDHPEVRALYGGRGYELAGVTMPRAINSDGRGRAPIAELLISNFAHDAALGPGAE